MRIGIDCRIYGATHGYMGKYMERFIDSLAWMTDEHEYVLFFHDQELTDFDFASSRLRLVKTSARIGSIAEQVIFPYELYREKLDIVFSIAPYSPLLYRRKTIALLPDLASYFYPTKPFKGTWMRNWSNFILRQTLRKASMVIALSDILKRDIIEIFDIHEDMIRVIPPMMVGVLDITESTPEDVRKLLVQENIQGKYILIEWELREYKNIPRFLQAYSQLLKEGSIDADLVLIGKEDPNYHEIRSELIELGLQGRVHIYNVFDENKRAFFQKHASLCVLPSLYEGSEQPILEALLYKTPILSSLLPTITTVLGKDEAIFFRPMSIPDIKDALKQSWEHPVSWKHKKDISIYAPWAVSEKIRDVLAVSPGK